MTAFMAGFMAAFLSGCAGASLGGAASTFRTMVVLTSTVVALGTSCATATLETTTSWNWASANAEVKVADAAIVVSKNKRSLVFMAAGRSFIVMGAWFGVRESGPFEAGGPFHGRVDQPPRGGSRIL